MDNFMLRIANRVCDLLEPYLDKKFEEQTARLKEQTALLENIEETLSGVLTEKDMDGYVARIANEVASRFVI